MNERPTPLIWRGGALAVDRSAGPLWAEAGWEMHAPWMEHHSRGGYVPFGQVHGHSAIVRHADQSWRCPGRVRQRASVDWAARHVRVRSAVACSPALIPNTAATALRSGNHWYWLARGC